MGLLYTNKLDNFEKNPLPFTTRLLLIAHEFNIIKLPSSIIVQPPLAHVCVYHSPTFSPACRCETTTKKNSYQIFSVLLFIVDSSPAEALLR